GGDAGRGRGGTGGGGKSERQPQAGTQLARERTHGHGTPRNECAQLYPVAEKKSAANGGRRARRQEANTGEELFADRERQPVLDYLETLTAWIAASCARASRAS